MTGKSMAETFTGVGAFGEIYSHHDRGEDNQGLHITLSVPSLVTYIEQTDYIRKVPQLWSKSINPEPAEDMPDSSHNITQRKNPVTKGMEGLSIQ